MILGKTVRTLGEAAKALGIVSAGVLALFTVPALAAAGASDAAPAAVAGYTPMKPTPGIGMPVEGGIGLQQQFSKLGEYGEWIHDGVLMPIITAITLFVLLLLVIIAVRFNRRANPVASKTSHNTILEVVWTLVPVLILIGIAVPSIDLIAKQYKPAQKGALTIKVTGNQWFWTYGYPDNGDFEVVSNMLNLPGQPVINNGVREVGSKPWDGPSHLEVDNRMVVPVGEPIRLQITAADVIHSFAVPSLWFKLDAVPGRINEKVLLVEKPGVYYGQCSELCGAKHGYMPIAVEALPRAQYDAWVLSHAGGVIDGQAKPAAAVAPAASTAAAPAAVATAEATEAAASDATAAAE
ncbi:cytochrome c oxidase subunit II [Novosphingobium aerophilum]|uniref:cytochrome c oxidase subunit II n=1 Tax=Novosphingobium TaxID=165696 RepID=UPI0006C85B62|nr:MULTISPECIES: cytochrome c oxidase subunit II [unclassified Novosphingobium]KPH64403.1 cytochrome C oxidase subunit II [Novosphingobium sp. ST904]MPS70377.1 cytochrome c oxidase subunit II [Novosphingobium sp.]TCM37410.1 cytochrome c oxidase subunit 2 [Novosphingobium sp. ST904]WRT93633.1 cytochrome c oxidase subunit II [Novosphingobium sp. RL4]